MTGSDILDYVESRMGVTVNTDNVLLAINEALDMLADDSLLYGTIDVTVTDKTEEYAMPDDFTFVEKVLMIPENGRTRLYNPYEYRNGIISFHDTGTFRIIARKMPTHLTAIGDSFTNLHRMYYQGIKFYALAWFKENDDPSDPAVKKYYDRAMSTFRKAKTSLNRSSEPKRIQVVRRG